MKNLEYRKLHAEWYEYLSDASPNLKPEIEFWTRQILASGEPALELGCGTGKIYIPLLEKGLDVTGIDTSQDMMERLRRRCQDRGLKPRVFEQSMLALALPQKFRTIYLPAGSLSLFTRNQDIAAMFNSAREHLAPGGVFLCTFEPLPEEPRPSSSQWTGNWVRGPGGVVIAWRQRWRFDPATRIWECLFIVEKFVSGRLVETEANEREGRFFTVDEAVALAQSGGFEIEAALHEFTDDPPRPDSDTVMLRCRKKL